MAAHGARLPRPGARGAALAQVDVKLLLLVDVDHTKPNLAALAVGPGLPGGEPGPVLPVASALAPVAQHDPQLVDSRLRLVLPGDPDHLKLRPEVGPVRLEHPAPAAPHHPVPELEGLHHPPGGGGAGLVQPDGVHVADLAGGVAPAGGLVDVSAVLGQDQPGRRPGLVHGVKKGVDDGHGLLGAGGVALDHHLGALPVRQLEDEGRQALVGPHGGVALQVVQVYLGPLVPQGLPRQGAGGLIRPGPDPGGLADPPDDVPALLVGDVLPAVGRHRGVDIVRVHVPAVFEGVPQLPYHGGEPAPRRGWQGVRRKEGPLRHQADDVHQGPPDGRGVLGGLPAVPGLVEHPDLDPLHPLGGLATHKQVQPLPLLNGLEDGVLVPGLEEPVVVVHGHLHGPVGQRQAGELPLERGGEAL